MQRLQRADPGARRRALVLIAAALIAGALLVAAFEHFEADVERWIELNLPYWLDYPLIPAAMTLLPAAPLIGAAVYLFILGAQVARARRFPPPGHAVIRDTPIVEGPAARRRGRAIQGISVLLAGAALSLPLLVGYLFIRLS